MYSVWLTNTWRGINFNLKIAVFSPLGDVWHDLGGELSNTVMYVQHVLNLAYNTWRGIDFNLKIAVN